MKQLQPVIFIAILTSACSVQQEKKQTPAIEPLQPVKTEKIILQDSNPPKELKTEIVSKTETVIPLSEALNAMVKQPIVKSKPPTKHQPVAAKKVTKPISNQKTVLTKPVTKPKPLVPPKIQPEETVAEPVKEPLQTAKLLPPIPSKQKPGNTINLSEDSFPIKFGSTWTLDLKHDANSNKNRCLLTSKKRNFYDGYDNASMYLQLTSSTMLIKTDSKIDLSYPGVGIYIDQNTPYSFDQIINESHAIIKKNLKTITARLVQGKKVTIKLGFWPTWPKTEISSIHFSLQDFGKAHQALQSCENL